MILGMSFFLRYELDEGAFLGALERSCWLKDKGELLGENKRIVKIR
jgi:hypothetical protein